MGEFDPAVAEGEEPLSGGPGEDGVGVGVLVEFRAGDGPFGVLGAFPEGDEVDEDLAGQVLLTAGE